MRRTRLRRALAQLGIAVLLASGASLISTSAASAGDCDDWYTPCGEVHNYSSKTLYVTTVLDFNLGRGPHECAVWNSNGGNSSAWRKVSCFQEPLGPGSSKGGGNVDVDAFTYADRDYMLDFHGTLSWITRGVWTRIQNWEGAYCYTDPQFGFPKCLIIYE